MKHLTILVPNGENNLSSIVGSYKIFNRANAIFISKGRNPIFTIELVGTTQKIGFYDDLFTVQAHKKLSEIKKTNFIIIPSLNHNFDSAVQENQEIIDLTDKQPQEEAEANTTPEEPVVAEAKSPQQLRREARQKRREARREARQKRREEWQ